MTHFYGFTTVCCHSIMLVETVTRYHPSTKISVVCKKCDALATAVLIKPVAHEKALRPT